MYILLEYGTYMVLAGASGYIHAAPERSPSSLAKPGQGCTITQRKARVKRILINVSRKESAI